MQNPCQQCGKKDAVIQISVAAGSSQNSYQLCSECAGKLGVHTQQQSAPVLNELYQSLLHGNNRLRRRMDESRCRQCGTPFGEIRRTQRAGCPSCYGAFSSGIRQLLSLGEQSVSYTGRLPRRVDALRRIFVVREQLRDQLEAAVASEDFEAAARIREDMHRLEVDSSEHPHA